MLMSENASLFQLTCSLCVCLIPHDTPLYAAPALFYLHIHVLVEDKQKSCAIWVGYLLPVTLRVGLALNYHAEDQLFNKLCKSSFCNIVLFTFK